MCELVDSEYRAVANTRGQQVRFALQLLCHGGADRPRNFPKDYLCSRNKDHYPTYYFDWDPSVKTAPRRPGWDRNIDCGSTTRRHPHLSITAGARWCRKIRITCLYSCSICCGLYCESFMLIPNFMLQLNPRNSQFALQLQNSAVEML